MKTLFSSLLLFTAIGTIPAFAEPMSAADRQFAVDHLKKTQKALEDAVSGLSEKQLKFVPAPGRWCIQQIAEHLAIAEDNWWKGLNAMIARIPVTPEKKTGVADAAAAFAMTDRSQKEQATGIWAPDGRWKNIREIMAHFAESRARMIDFVANTQDDLRHRIVRDGQDAYQQMLDGPYHVERHLQQ